MAAMTAPATAAHAETKPPCRTITEKHRLYCCTSGFANASSSPRLLQPPPRHACNSRAMNHHCVFFIAKPPQSRLHLRPRRAHVRTM
ncbi:hypothetical protein DEO72_LG7g1934 [Vigna unguiculata]|uniref:Uncharacterized protein n=1 Tax=Vigna unguiculata TaxID=3917 RepID=A0A4D6MIM9_VIGUN|nr:hypothetical protein DEO72_LG7g1934 [Vigna unguiculata]